MKSQLGLSLLTFFVFVLFGAFFSFKSWGPANFRTSGVRDPANIPSQLDFSKLDGTALREASLNRIISELKVLSDTDRFGIEFGHFWALGTQGHPMNACDIYDVVELTFHAEGVAESGDRPVMKVQSPCRVSQYDDSKIQPVWIPFKQVLNEPTGDFVIQYPEYEVELTFESVSSEWPTEWILDEIRLFSSMSPSRQIVVETEEMRARLQQPIGVTWQATQDRLPTSSEPATREPDSSQSTH